MGYGFKDFDEVFLSEIFLVRLNKLELTTELHRVSTEFFFISHRNTQTDTDVKKLKAGR